MPYSSDIQIVNDPNGSAHAFLADNGLLFACQWNAQAQRWEKGEVVPGSQGARDLQALVVDDLWPSGGASGAVPGNAQGIVLAYRVGNGASSQVVASFGAWGSDGNLTWTQALPLSSQQGDDEAFALVPSAAGTLRLVLQKREATASPQELLAQFSENPSELLGKQLDALASGTRKDSDLYVSDLQINSTGNGGYALQLSAPGASPNSHTTALTPAKPTPTPATPAPAFGGNTQLSRAALAANAAPSLGLQSAGRLTADPALLGAPAASPVTFAQAGATAGGGRGFGFTNYIKNPASLAGLALYPVRYSLGTALGSTFEKLNTKDAPIVESPDNFDQLTERSSFSSSSSGQNGSQIFAEQQPGSPVAQGLQLLPEFGAALSTTKRAASLTLNPLGGLGSSEVVTVARKSEKIESLLLEAPRGVSVRSAGLTGGSAEGAANLMFANPTQREFTLSGAYGGQLAGRGGYSVLNFSTFRYGNPALDSYQAANAGAYGQFLDIASKRDPRSRRPSFAFGERYSPGWKLGQGLAGSFKTLFQYSSPTSFGGATKLIGFNAQQSLGWNLLAHKATYFDSGARFSLDLSLIAGFVMEQSYASAAGLSRPLADTGLAVGVLGNALSLFQLGFSLSKFGNWRETPKGLSPLTTNALYVNNTGQRTPGTGIRYAATAGGIASLGLAVGIPVGVGASQMNANGTYTFGLGLQENVRARLLSKYGVGLEVIAGSQQNLLWTIGEGFANPSLQVLAFASVGAALPLGAFIPVIPNISWEYESNPPSTAAAAPAAAAPVASAPGDLGGPAPLAASSTPPVSRGTYIVAPTGSAYPMGYVPASATDALLALPNGPIASLLDAPTTLEWHQLRSFSASQLNSGVLAWSNNNTFVGLNDGTYTNVPLVGLGLPGTSPATASFTASGGVISNLVVQGARSLSLPGWISDGILTLQAASDPGLQNEDAVTGSAVMALDLPGPLLISGLAVAYDPTSQLVSYRLNQSVSLGGSSNPQTIAIETSQGQYLALPEPKSGRYVFGLDVFQQQSGNPAPPALPTAGSVVDSMPLFSLQTATGSNNSPLSTAKIQRIQAQLPISGLTQGSAYPKADGSNPAANDYSVYSYSKVPITLLPNDGSGTPITPLNAGVTATVKLSAGSIVDVSLDQPLYFPLPTSAYAGLPYTLVVDVEQALGNPGLVNPTITVSAQQQALNNFTDQDSFSANASIHNAGVFLSSGVSDQLPLLASYGRLPVQNRVSYVDGDTVVYLNNTGGSSASWQAVSSSQLTLEAIYNDPGNTHFTAASNPTAITDTASNTTYVFWVEASDPVIPLTGSDGEANYQAFMNALYGHQRINYSYATTSQAGTNTKWNYVNVNDLYAPADTLITDLRSFVVQVDGVQRSLLVWTEVPISALKSAEANPQELIDSQLAVIKAGLINPAAASAPGGYTWEALFNDANGQSSIATIPWNSDRGSGLSIADLSAASLQLQVEPVARFSGTIYGTTLTVSPLSSGSLSVGDLILGTGVKAGTTITAITRAASASSAGSYQVSTSQTVSSTNLAAVPLSGEAASSAITFAGSFSGSGNTTLTLSSGATALAVGDQLFGVGIEPGTFITAVLSFDPTTGAGSFAINHGPATASANAALLALPDGTPTPDSSQTLTTPVLSWSEAVRTPYNQAVLASAPLLYVPMAGLQSGVNSLNLGSASSNADTFASSTGLNTSIAGALPKSTATAVQNVQGLGVLATGLGTLNGPTLELLRNSPQTPADPAANPVAIFNASLNGTSLTVTSVSQGTLAVGELLVGEGIPAGTTIAALPGSPSADQSGTYTLTYAPGADSSTVVAATTLRSLSNTGRLPLASFQGSFSGSAGANGYTTLDITNLSGSLQIGDQVLGLGLPGGCTVEQVLSSDLNSGSAQVIVSQGPQTAGGSYALAGTAGGSSSPYTIEFWTQLSPDSNPAGAGLVALGQPTANALPDRPVELPEGWLLSSSFGVEQLTWQDALNLSLETSLDGNSATDVYGWRWAVVADGTNTTAMDGNGGNNLYRNALLLNNLLVGDTIEGVNSFLAAYGLTSSDLTGFDGTPVDQIASSPSTQFQFSSTFSPNQALGGESVPTTSLNGVAIDTSTAEMNGGIVLAAQANANANLNAMFQNLWNFEQTYGQSKVNFSLNPLTQPAPSTPSTPPSANRIEQYGGYQLQFVLQPGPAVSVNGIGQISFDVAPGVTLLSADGIDYRDNIWHYVATSFLPDYTAVSASGTALDLPRNVGTANLYVDGKVVATQAGVINPYAASNFNDAAQLLSDNASGAIDLLAIYGQALSTSQPPAAASDWPMPTSSEGLALLQEAGFVVASKTPNPGQQPGAISNHYLAHTVDPNNAAKSTFTSALLPNANGGLSWSEASTLNPEAAITPSTASASTLPLQSALLLPIAPQAWGQKGWYANTAPSTAAVANPAGQTLKGITVTLTPVDGGTVVTRQLSPQEVLLGASTLAALQPKAKDGNFAYTFLSNQPALNLYVTRQPSGSSDSNILDANVTYSANVSLQFADGSSVSNTAANGSTGVALGLGGSLASTLTADILANRTALATADVLEEAPLQLKYIDSGVQLSSQNSPSDASPATTFGSSQVYGSFANSGTSSNSGWLAISQPRSSNAKSDPAGRVWINFAGKFTTSTDSQGNKVSSAVSDASQAPTTWLNALAASDFSPNRPNLPLLNSATYQSSVGGLLIKADASAGWGQNFGTNMLVADVNNDGTDDLIIAAPQANGGGAVVIIDGTWIANNLTSSTGQTILDLSNPSNLGSYVTVLRPGNANSGTDITTAAGFGTALAFQSGTSGTAGTLWIGAPNYLRTLDASNVQDSTQPIGALYSYSSSTYNGSWGSATPTTLTRPILGNAGTVTIPEAGKTSSTNWWGAQLGTAVAISSSGDLAVSAPGVVGAMVYTGTEAITDAYNNFNLNAKPELSSGLLYRLTVGPKLDATQPVNSSKYTTISGLQADNLSTNQKNFLTAFQNQMVTQVAGATMQNNQAIQAAAIGAVMVFSSGANVSSLGNTVLTASGVNALNGRTYYGPNPLNTLGDSGFGSSVSFADLNNTNSDQLIVGASQSGGGGLVYMIDPTATYSDKSLGTNQYVAILAATNVVTAAQASDTLGSGLVNLGDVNKDGYDDILIQAFNAASSAGIGYVMFGSDGLSTSNGNAGLIGLAPGSIGTIQYANGTSSNLAILSELGSAGGITGQGSYGPGDYNADGLNDIPIGSGPNAKGYLTWGHPYLESVTSLQLSRLASNSGFMLDGLATTTQGSLRSIGDFNGDGYGDFISTSPGPNLTTVRIELGGNTQEILADAAYSYYTFTVANGTQVLPGGDINGDGMGDIALFLDQNLSSAADGNQGAGSTTGILYGRNSGDLPLGSGFGFIAPVDPISSAPVAPLPGVAVEKPGGEVGLTDATASVIAVGNTLYAAVKGKGDNTLWFTQSSDGGNNWDNWSELTSINSGFTTSTGPSLAYFNDTLYLSFVNSAGSLSLSSWDPCSSNLLAWSTPTALSGSTADATAFSSSTAPQLVDRGDSLGVLWVQNDSVVAASTTEPATANTWTNPQQLNVLDGGNADAINSSDAPSFTWLGTTPVLAVNEGGTIQVYAGQAGGSTLQLASSFLAPAGLSIVSAPVLTTTDTGLALTYTNSDGSISLQRLNLANSNGSPLSGVQLTSDGGVDASQADLQWQTTLLTQSNSGISSSLASTPVSVNGNLLLTNIRNSVSQASQIWINAVPNASDPASTTWLNTTVQLPDGNGGSLLSQRAGVDNIIGSLTAGAWQDANSPKASTGYALSAPSLTRNGNTVYMAVRGTDNHLYWNSSTDNGVTWGSWQGLPAAMGTYMAPSIAYFNNKLYLCYVAAGSQDLNITSLQGGNTWNDKYKIYGQTATAASMIAEGDKLAVYFVSQDSSDRILKSYTGTPGDSNWKNTSVLYGANYSQTASSNLALTRYNGQTYIAYQGGTYGNPSSTTYLTTASDSVANGSSPVWTLLDIPAGADSLTQRGVGLTSGSNGLVLTYTDSSKPDQVAVQISNADVTDWGALSDAMALSSSTGYTPLITGDSQNSLLIAGNASNNAIKAQLNALNAQVLDPSQTGSTISAIGDLNGDGFDDLAITANNVAYSPSGNLGSSDAQLTTGVRLLLGAASANAFSSANNANSSQQTVQIADLYRQQSTSDTVSSVTPLANLTGPTSLTLNGRLDGHVVQITSTETGSSFSDASLSASASDPKSLNQLFAGASVRTTSSPASSQAQGTGSPSLQTLAGYGDLNGDGRVDYLAPDGLKNVYSGDGAIAYDVWSIRAAGDVNGNGVDDVIVTLSPTETNGQWLQTALLDGAIFSVQNNQFSLAQAEGSFQNGWTSAGLKEGLNPYQHAYSENTPPGLQQWVQPILDYEPGNTLSDLTTGNATRLDSINSQPLAVDLNSTVGPDGTIYILSGIQADNYSVGTGYKNTTSQLFYGNPESPASEWQRAIVPVPNAGFLCSMAVYDGHIFANYYNSKTGIQSICSASLTTDLSNSSNWASYALSTPGSGQLINEGDRLALYVCNAQGLLTALYATSQPSTLGGNIPSPITSTSWGGTLGDAGFSGPPVTINTVIDNSGSSAPLNAGGGLVATRFQGKTILAYYKRNSDQSNHTLFTAQADSDQPGATFSSHATGLGTWYTSDYDSSSGVSSLHLAANSSEIYLLQQNPFTASDAIQIVTGSSYKEWSNSVSWSNSSNTSPTFAASVSESALYLTNYLAISGAVSIAQADVAQSAPQQRSLAGYSIDGNLDINGDGFNDMLVSDASDPAKSVDNQYALFGGDYFKIATQVGTPGNDVIQGTTLDDVIYTIQGSDQVSSQGGADVIYTGAGDDQISIVDNGFIRIDAGSGFDVLQLQGRVNQSYDFRLDVSAPEYFPGTKLRDIELITSQDYGANVLRFDVAAVNAINPDRILFLTPDKADTIILSSEFQANPAFNTNVGGLLWTAYAAGDQTTPADSSPTLVYLLNPSGASGSDWLNSHVIFDDSAPASSSTSAPSLLATAAPQPSSPITLPTTGGPISSTPFGDGLELRAYPTSPSQGYALFELHRNDASTRQVISYVSSSAGSTAEAGRDYTAVAGVVVLDAGQSSQLISVPLNSDAFARLKGAQISLEVQQLPDFGQSPLDLLIQPGADKGNQDGLAPSLSGLTLTPSVDGTSLSFGFRADTTTTVTSKKGSRQLLDLVIGQRPSADVLAASRFQSVQLADEAIASTDRVATAKMLFSDLARDRDRVVNGQVSTELSLKVEDGDGTGEVTMAADGRYVDANRDRIPDAAQSRVVALSPINEGASAADYAALSVPKRLQLADVSLLPAPALNAAPALLSASSDNPLSDPLSFKVTGLKSGAKTKVTYNLPSNYAGDLRNFDVFISTAVSPTSLDDFTEFVDAKGRALYKFFDSDKNGTLDSIRLKLRDGAATSDADGSRDGVIQASFYLAESQPPTAAATFAPVNGIVSGQRLARPLDGSDSSDQWPGCPTSDIVAGDLAGDPLAGGPGADSTLQPWVVDAMPSSDDIVTGDLLDPVDVNTINSKTLLLGCQPFQFVGPEAFEAAPGEFCSTSSVLPGDNNDGSQVDPLLNPGTDDLLSSQALLL